MSTPHHNHLSAVDTRPASSIQSQRRGPSSFSVSSCVLNLTRTSSTQNGQSSPSAVLAHISTIFTSSPQPGKTRAISRKFCSCSPARSKHGRERVMLLCLRIAVWGLGRTRGRSRRPGYIRLCRRARCSWACMPGRGGRSRDSVPVTQRRWC